LLQSFKPEFSSVLHVGVPLPNHSVSPLSLRERARVRAAIRSVFKEVSESAEHSHKVFRLSVGRPVSSLCSSLPIQRPGVETRVTTERTSAIHNVSLRTFTVCTLLWRLCVGDLVSAGLPLSRVSNLRTAATYSLGNRMGATGGESSAGSRRVEGWLIDRSHAERGNDQENRTSTGSTVACVETRKRS
jgi:hypothetical protein